MSAGSWFPALIAPLCGGAGLLWDATLRAERADGRKPQPIQDVGAACLLIVGGVGCLVMVSQAIAMLLSGWQIDPELQHQIRCLVTCRGYRGGWKKGATLATHWPWVLLVSYGLLFCWIAPPLSRLLRRSSINH